MPNFTHYVLLDGFMSSRHRSREHAEMEIKELCFRHDLKESQFTIEERGKSRNG